MGSGTGPSTEARTAVEWQEALWHVGMGERPELLRGKSMLGAIHMALEEIRCLAVGLSCGWWPPATAPKTRKQAETKIVMDSDRDAHLLSLPECGSVTYLWAVPSSLLHLGIIRELRPSSCNPSQRSARGSTHWTAPSLFGSF